MAFTKALYYPWIDIKNEAWLKNAMLYWEQIQTIVPESIEQPYNTKTSLEFSNEGLLVPLRVNSYMSEIRGLAEYVWRYLESPEIDEITMASELPEYNYLHSYKLPEGVRHFIEIHEDKFSLTVRDRIFRELERNNPDVQRDGFVKVAALFADYYMTILAACLSNSVGAGLLTDGGLLERLAISAWFDNRAPKVKSDLPKYRVGRVANGQIARSPLAQGILANLVLQGIQVDPETPVKKILKFRKNCAAELGRFRQKVGELTDTIPKNQPIEALRQHVSDVYLNEVRPAIDDLEKGLEDIEIKWAANNLLKVSCFSLPSTSIPLALLGLSVPYALLVGAGISLTASRTLYNRNRKKFLRQNPFSYVLATEKEFKRRR